MPKLFDRVKVNIATTGTGDITFGAASSNAFLTPAEAGGVDSDTVRYVIVDGTDFEEGIGTIASSVAEMERTIVTKSKISGTAGTSKINLSGTAVLALTAAAADIVVPANNLSDLASAPTALTNLGGTTVGKALFTAADAAAARTAAGVGTGAAASKSDQQTGTSATTAVTPSQQQSHDSAAKHWSYFTWDGSAHTHRASYNYSGFTRNSAGRYTVSLDTPFSSTNFACLATVNGTRFVLAFPNSSSSVTVNINDTSGSASDAGFSPVCFGRQ